MAIIIILIDKVSTVFTSLNKKLTIALLIVFNDKFPSPFLIYPFIYYTGSKSFKISISDFTLFI